MLYPRARYTISKRFERNFSASSRVKLSRFPDGRISPLKLEYRYVNAYRAGLGGGVKSCFPQTYKYFIRISYAFGVCLWQRRRRRGAPTRIFFHGTNGERDFYFVTFSKGTSFPLPSSLFSLFFLQEKDIYSWIHRTVGGKCKATRGRKIRKKIPRKVEIRRSMERNIHFPR